jgi:hypothetical protein
MKAYLVTTGTLFALVTLVHVWRAVQEGPSLATDPWFVLITAVGAVLCVWAWRLLRMAANARRAAAARSPSKRLGNPAPPTDST